MKLRYAILEAEELAPYVAQLLELERAIRYPIEGGEDHFIIDHGPSYTSFFTDMGRSYFLLVFDGERVVGSIAGVFKSLSLGGRDRTGLYLADLKLHHEYRGLGVPAQMIWHALARWPFARAYQGWSFLFYAAMQGAYGDVNRTFKGLHLGRLVVPSVELKIFFIPPTELLELPPGELSELKKGAAELSPTKSEELAWNLGQKTFRLESTGEPWKLAHLPTFQQASSDRLRGWAKEIDQKDSEALLCFAVDQRNSSMIEWLEARGLTTNTDCLIYALSFHGFSLSQAADWLLLSTAEI
jgi:hypothetical protein